jgi:FkbM family methyltransferase
MDNPHAHRIQEFIAETRAAAANIEHPWDKDAITWSDITRKSVVVDVGGYKGRWALQMEERYQPRLYVFEPQPWAAAVCQAVLGERANVYPYALGVEDSQAPMGAWETDGCSLLRGDHTGEPVPIREMGAALRELGITQIDLLMMNCEGYEFLLIPHMLQERIFPRRILVQFHLVNPGFAEAFERIKNRMKRAGYRVILNYGLTLMGWER